MSGLSSTKERRHDRGFTLIEIMIAITLLSVGLLGMAGLTVGIIRSNSLSSEVTEATTLAQTKMEDIKRLGYSGVTAQSEAYNTISGYPTYRRVTQVANTPTGMKTVTITVLWSNDVSSLAVETILSP